MCRLETTFAMAVCGLGISFWINEVSEYHTQSMDAAREYRSQWLGWVGNITLNPWMQFANNHWVWFSNITLNSWLSFGNITFKQWVRFGNIPLNHWERLVDIKITSYFTGTAYTFFFHCTQLLLFFIWLHCIFGLKLFSS